MVEAHRAISSRYYSRSWQDSRYRWKEPLPKAAEAEGCAGMSE